MTSSSVAHGIANEIEYVTVIIMYTIVTTFIYSLNIFSLKIAELGTMSVPVAYIMYRLFIDETVCA